MMDLPMCIVMPNGHVIREGSLVECCTNGYISVRRGERRRVIRIEDGCLILENPHSPLGTSPYRAENFRLIQEAQVANSKIYVAFPIEEGQNYGEYARALVSRYYTPFDADTSYAALKRRLEAHIASKPSDRFMIFGGTTIGEIAAPPVRWRDA